MSTYLGDHAPFFISCLHAELISCICGGVLAVLLLKAFLTFCSGTQELIAVGRDGLGNEKGRGRAVLADHKTFRVKLASVAALMSFWSDVLRSSL